MRRGARSAVALAAVLGFVWLPSPGATQATGSFTVTPDTGLHTGDTVTIEGSGYTPNAQVGFCQAIPNTGDENDCGKTGGFATTDANGDFSANYAVLRFITSSLGSREEVDCRAPGSNCMIGVAEVDVDQFPVPGTVSFQPISFDPEPIDDLIVRRRSDGQLFFDNIYEPFGSLGCCSTEFRKHALVDGKWTYALRIQNDEEVTDDIIVTATPSSATRYFVGYYEVTAAVHGSGFTFADVDPNETLAFGVQFRSADREVFVRIRSATNGLIENIIRLDVVPP